MKIPGYDEWKLQTPPEYDGPSECPVCGAETPEECSPVKGKICPIDEPDPDYLRDLREDR